MSAGDVQGLAFSGTPHSKDDSYDPFSLDPVAEAREGFHHFLDSSGLEGELTDMEILAFEERFMEEMQVP